MLVRSLHAESLKYRRTLALGLALGGPAALVGLFLLVYALNPQLHTLPAAKKWDWMSGNLFPTWNILFLPLGTAILAALATHLEHAENHLKHILTLPPSWATVFIAKLIAVFGLVFLGSLVLSCSFVLVGVLIGAGQPIPWETAFRSPLIAFVGLSPVLALGVWLGLRWRSFVIGVGVGMGGTVAGAMAVRSSTYWKFVPWTYPTVAGQTGTAQAELAFMLVAVLVVMVIAWGVFDFARRDAP